jgi:peptidoglycan/LPS O-acetylase OafA/YrhL
MISYRREIDGLRALAVLPVILFHAGIDTFSGGFVGVDVFFVISGYLITSIILSEKEAGTFSIINFYERRARRILPALFLVIIICIPFAWLWLLPSDMKDFSQSLVAVSIFASNILFWRESGYFETAAELKPLLHTWSLALEEQYYMLFPLFILLTWRLGKRWIVGILAVLSIASLAVAHWGAYNIPSPTFFLLPTRGWELAIGAFIAFYLSSKEAVIVSKTTKQIASTLGLVLILSAVFIFNKNTPFPSLYALVPTIGTALIILFTAPNTFVGRVLGAKAFVGIGLISYSAYLWHQPLFAFARHRSLGEVSEAVFILLAIAALILAYVSWRFVEVPFRDKRTFTRKQIATLAISFSTIFVAIGLVGHFTNGGFGRSDETIRLSVIEDRLRLNHGLSKDCDGEFTLSENCRTNGEQTVLVWGDSYAMHLVQGLIASNPDLKIIQATISVCGPFFDIAPLTGKYGRAWSMKCIESNDHVYKLLQNSPNIKYVVMSSPFRQYVEEDANVLTRDGDILNGTDVSYDYMSKTLNRIKALGKIPVIFSPTPENGHDIGRCLTKAEQFGKDSSVCDFNIEEAKIRQNSVYEFLEKISTISSVVLLHEGICIEGKCKASINNIFIYRDSGHLSHEGSALIGKRMNFYGLLHTAAQKGE